ncbi:UNVERIFIED_CONTAM: hypothetical protein Sradi_7146200 [Sesamum radiatum]|uniref:Uncharacterized protein n=1 Tax=Sesamum radiatum TaxID=300843 RepID=A0AAW2IW88_SESRA
MKVSGNTQVLLVIAGTSLDLASGGSTPAPPAPVPPPPRSASPVANPPRHNTSSDTSEENYP